MAHLIGSIEVGKWADLVLWDPRFFGATPEIVIKGGVIAYAQMGDPNASIPTPQPVKMRPMFGMSGRAVGPTSIAFVSRACYARRNKDKHKNSHDNENQYLDHLLKHVEPVMHCRDVTKRDMKFNDMLPKISVDPETYQVQADGVHLTCAPATTLPLSQTHFLF
jgi:urease alpha subunit